MLNPQRLESQMTVGNQHVSADSQIRFLQLSGLKVMYIKHVLPKDSSL